MELVDRMQLGEVLGSPVSQDRFDALYARALDVVKTAYDEDPEAAAGKALSVVSSVMWSVVIRIATNPAGAQQVTVSDGNASFPVTRQGSPFALTDQERSDLEALNPSTSTGKPVWSYSPYRDPIRDPWDVL